MNRQPFKTREAKIFLIVIFILTSLSISYGQTPSIKYELEAHASGTTNHIVPFWMRSDQFGSVPIPGASASFIGRIIKEYQVVDTVKKLIDWGFGFEGRTNIGKGSNAVIIEAYSKIRLGIFQLKAGRTKDVMGLNGDTTLSSGNFAISGNALGIPKVEISIPNYWRLPILGGIFSVKGNFAHGWLGRTKILDSLSLENPGKKDLVFYTNNNNPDTYFHQKSFYLRLGKPHWKLNLIGGFNHQVFWGNETAAYGNSYKLSSAETFYYVAIGKAYGAPGIPRSKIGNQIGSIDVGAKYDFKRINVFLYRQTFYDVGALSKLANLKDGINGIYIENKQKSKLTGFNWKKLLFEFIYSKDQAGYPWSKPTASGDEDYYNNYYYVKGWSYKGYALGSPLFTEKTNAKIGQATRPADYFINNRIIALNLGFSGSFKDFQITSKVSYSHNYGTFGTSIYGNSTGHTRYPQSENLFVPVKQLSLYLESSKQIRNGYNFAIATSFDQGKLLNNSIGIIAKIKKSFN